jgi:hypothetical protein
VGVAKGGPARCTSSRPLAGWAKGGAAGSSRCDELGKTESPAEAGAAVRSSGSAWSGRHYGERRLPGTVGEGAGTLAV